MNSPPSLTVQELKDRLQKREKLHLIDVRLDWEYQLCSLPNSFHIPLSELAERLDSIPREGEIIVLCHHGVRSFQAAMLLLENNFLNVLSLKGGIDAWAKQIDPLVATY